MGEKPRSSKKAAKLDPVVDKEEASDLAGETTEMVIETPSKKEAATKKEGTKSTAKKSKKEKDEAEDAADDVTTTTPNTKEERKRKRNESKAAKAKLLEQVPKVDKEGISYTNAQVRRMVRRVKRGLTAVPTPHEEAELKKSDKAQRQEEELQWAGLLYNKGEVGAGSGSDDDSDGDGSDDDGSDDEGDKETKKGSKDKKKDKKTTLRQPTKEEVEATAAHPPSKKPKVKKPVPADYVCFSCQNKHTTAHWIYDCPDKVKMRGTNAVSASQKGIDQAPSAKKVFVSGLPFETKSADVKAMFESGVDGKVTSIKLLKFPDTGRCKGQAFVVFDTEESALKAIAMSGTKITPPDDDGNTKNKKKDKASASAAPKRELELKVTNVQNRNVTKLLRRSSAYS